VTTADNGLMRAKREGRREKGVGEEMRGRGSRNQKQRDQRKVNEIYCSWPFVHHGRGYLHIPGQLKAFINLIRHLEVPPRLYNIKLQHDKDDRSIWSAPHSSSSFWPLHTSLTYEVWRRTGSGLF